MVKFFLEIGCISNDYMIYLAPFSFNLCVCTNFKEKFKKKFVKNTCRKNILFLFSPRYTCKWEIMPI